MCPNDNLKAKNVILEVFLAKSEQKQGDRRGEAGVIGCQLYTKNTLISQTVLGDALKTKVSFHHTEACEF
jgi:hypothetical protein